MTDKWIKDTGLVVALVFIVLGISKDREDFLIVSAVFLLLSILTPRVIYPIAFLWFKLTELLGLVVPKIFFGFVFFVIILPAGFLRRFMKGDTLFISNWRKIKTSFIERNHRFIKQDMETPY